MPRMTLKLLGQSTIEIDGKVCKFRQKRSAALLIYCVLEQKLIDRDILCDLLWPGYDNQTARKRLSDALSALKADLEKNSPNIQISDYLTITPDSVQPVQGCTLNCDVLEFESLSSDDIPISETLEKACELYGGSFLAAFGMRGIDQAWEHWQSEKQRALEDQYFSILHDLSIAYLHEGKYQQVTPLLSQLQAKDEEDQSLYVFLMLCHYANRESQRVRKTYERYTKMMESSFESPREAFIENLWTEINKGGSAKIEPHQLLTDAFNATQSFEDSDLKQHIQTFIVWPKQSATKPSPPSDTYRRIERRLKQQFGMIGTSHLFLILCQEDAELAAMLLGHENLQTKNYTAYQRQAKNSRTI